MQACNAYEDSLRAGAYAKLEFPGTYYLAYRDIPRIVSDHVSGRRAIDFGCGTGRSARFLRKLGFEVVGLDISEEMILEARERDPQGDYRLIADGEFSRVTGDPVDLVLSAFTFDNIPTEGKPANFLGLSNLLRPGGRMINLVSSPQIYLNEWASFSTKDYPENSEAKSGDRVKIIITAIADGRPVEDVVCSDEDYRELYARAGLELIETHRPLGRADEPQEWVNETRIPPWTIYVLGVRP